MCVKAGLGGAWCIFQANRTASAKTWRCEEEHVGTLGYCWSGWQDKKGKG